MNIFGIKLCAPWWKKTSKYRSETIARLRSKLKGLSKNDVFLRVELYTSLCPDIDLICFFVSTSVEGLLQCRAEINKALGGYNDIKYGFVSVYSANKNEDKSKNDNLDFFVAYPVKKDSDWYLLDENERKRVMAEHIAMATNSKNNDSVKSYTTRSFGICDADFVVAYELPKIHDWVKLTEELRGAKAHKWVVEEKPVLVGYIGGFEWLSA